jgi:hypothetical protein
MNGTQTPHLTSSVYRRHRSELARVESKQWDSANITRILPVFCTKGAVLLEVNLDKLTKIS